MERALELAKMGSGNTNPNPLVGAVIVKEGRIIGEGYHEIYGSHHAEVNAFINATEEVSGATMYVTLEPCSHFGKTPPCANAIVKNKIKKVIIGLKDPNPMVAGRGIKILKDNGIEVVTGVLSKEGKKLNEIFLKYITGKIPFCILKTEMHLDTKISTYTGESRWVTEEFSRKYLHELRHRVAGIMVGIDNPLGITRSETLSDPIRIIVDSSGKIPTEAKLLKLNSKTIIATTEKVDKAKIEFLKKKGVMVIITPIKDGKIDLKFLMKTLGEQGIDSVLLEGESELNYLALEEGIVDKIDAFITPKVIGGDYHFTEEYVEGRSLCLLD